MKNGVFPGKVQQPPPDTKKWLLRFNTLFWFVTMLVIPVTFMLLTLSWTTLLTLLLLGSLGESVIKSTLKRNTSCSHVPMAGPPCFSLEQTPLFLWNIILILHPLPCFWHLIWCPNRFITIALVTFISENVSFSCCRQYCDVAGYAQVCSGGQGCRRYCTDHTHFGRGSGKRQENKLSSPQHNLDDQVKINHAIWLCNSYMLHIPVVNEASLLCRLKFCVGIFFIRFVSQDIVSKYTTQLNHYLLAWTKHTMSRLCSHCLVKFEEVGWLA